MKHKVLLCLLSFTSIAWPMDNDNQKKRTLVQALDSKLPKKKKRFPSDAQKAFDEAIERKDIQAGYRILNDHRYYPKEISLEQAIRKNDTTDFIYWLCALRTTPNDHYGNGLIAATALGNTFFMKLLLEAGAPVHTENENGWTPLSLAVYQNHVHAMLLLLAHGAHENIPSTLHGRTPLYYLTRFFSREAAVPTPVINNLIIDFIAHAQWNERPGPLPLDEDAQPLSFSLPIIFININKEVSKRCIVPALLSMYRCCPTLPRSIRHKILSYMPEDIYSEKLFRLIFPFVQDSHLALEQLVEICPFTWFKNLGKAKLASCTAASSEYADYIQTVAPLIAAYRLRRARELMAPLPEPCQTFVKNCIDALNHTGKHLLCYEVINDLTQR
ncbi:MAG: ankyrin repeat domain-containing protein [Candidatus Babeliales bacterium]